MVTASTTSPYFTIPCDLGEDRNGVRVPLGEHRASLDVIAFFDLHERAVGECEVLALATRLVDDRHCAMAVHHDDRTVALGDELGVVELHDAARA